MVGKRSITATSYGYDISLDQSDSDSSELAVSPRHADCDNPDHLMVLRASSIWRATTVRLKRERLQMQTCPTWPKFLRDVRIVNVDANKKDGNTCARRRAPLPVVKRMKPAAAAVETDLMTHMKEVWVAYRTKMIKSWQREGRTESPNSLCRRPVWHHPPACYAVRTACATVTLPQQCPLCDLP